MVLKFSSQEEYDELLASNTSIVIFTANWCKYLFLNGFNGTKSNFQYSEQRKIDLGYFDLTFEYIFLNFGFWYVNSKKDLF